jgi:hypothetical protein
MKNNGKEEIEFEEGSGNVFADLGFEDAALWECENQTDVEREETLVAIRQGLKDADEGRVRPFEEFDREFRAKHGLPPNPVFFLRHSQNAHASGTKIVTVIHIRMFSGMPTRMKSVNRYPPGP